MYDAQAAHAHAAERSVRQVDGILDVAVEQVVIQLICRHDRAAILTFRRARAEMRHGDDVRRFQDHFVREVGHVLCDGSALKSGGHRFVVHDLRA